MTSNYDYTQDDTLTLLARLDNVLNLATQCIANKYTLSTILGGNCPTFGDAFEDGHHIINILEEFKVLNDVFKNHYLTPYILKIISFIMILF